MSPAQTPEDAARGEIPERYACVLAAALSPDGNHAVVLLGTNEPPRLYPYQVVCGRGDEGWVEEISGNGPGWSATAGEGEPNMGVVTLWNEAPTDATAAIVSVLGQEIELPVENGYFFFAAWDVHASLEPAFVRWVTSA